MRELVFKIFRFNRETDYLPSYQRYELEISRGEVVLDALNRVKAELDPTLSYRKSCRHGICGSCAVKVENRAVLACKANLWELADCYGEELTIDPLDTKLAIRDLIVDKTRFWESYRAVSPWLEAPIDPAPKAEYRVPPQAAERLESADACIECGACFYSCPVVAVNDDFLGPAALAKSYRFAADIRDLAEADRLRFASGEGRGVWDCVKCYQCAAVCPKEVSPIDKITKLHTMSFKAGVAQNSIATRHAIAFKTSVEKIGRLDEAASARQSVGILGALKHAREAAAMLRRGKLKFFTPKIEKLDEVKKLIKIAEREAQ